MKKIMPLLCLLLCTQCCFAQIDKAAASILKFSVYTNENIKLDSLTSHNFGKPYSENPMASIELGEVILKQALKSNDVLLQSYDFPKMIKNYLQQAEIYS